jgi:hypothetical protein
MNDVSKLWTMLVQKEKNLSKAVKFYLVTVQNYHTDLIFIENITQIMIDFFQRRNYSFELKISSMEEGFSIISLFSVFAALRSIKVQVLTTKLRVGGTTLDVNFLWNPFVTKSTPKYVSVDAYRQEERIFPKNIEISASSSFRRSKGNGLVISQGILNPTLQGEGRYSLDQEPHLSLHLTSA